MFSRRAAFKLLAQSRFPGHLSLADVSIWKIPHNESTTQNYTLPKPFSQGLQDLEQVNNSSIYMNLEDSWSLRPSYLFSPKIYSRIFFQWPFGAAKRSRCSPN